MQEFIAIFLLLTLSLGFAVAMLLAGWFLSVKAENKIKNSTFECGMKIFRDAKIQFNASFFVYALLFLIFDVETILLFPFAIIYEELGLLAFIEAGIFVLLLLLGLYYAIKTKMLRFK